MRDKRAVELSLSAAGRKRAEEASRLGASFNAQTLAPLDKQERAAFLEMLARLVEGYRSAATCYPAVTRSRSRRARHRR